MLKVYKCNHCGNVIVKLLDAGVPVMCCGEQMVELKENSTEAATEKHLPVLTRDGHVVNVEVSTVTHPMTPEHWITFIAIETEKGYQIKRLDPTDAPKASFVEENKVIKVYEYCNLHGLWVSEGE